jgi:mannose-6-phosphate isomerase-like protein (cupin superfamily)
VSGQKRYAVAHVPAIDPVQCPCGRTRRAFVGESDRRATLHVVDITLDARTHYHKNLTELYYVLEGTGRMDLDGDSVDVRPGTAVLIRPGCRHRAVGELRVLVVAVPAFDPADEWFD